MTIRKSPYETKACEGFVLEKTIRAIEEARINGWLGWYGDNQTVRTVDQTTGGPGAIPSFSHPILLKKDKTDLGNQPHIGEEDTFFSIVDVRAFGRFENGAFTVKNSTDYNMTILRGQLNSVWVNRSPNLLRDVSSLAIGVYASWISESIARRYVLDPREQMILAIMAAIFYNSCFTDEPNELEEREKQRLTNLITKTLRVKAEDVFGVLDQVSVITDVNHFCKLAAEITQSIRLQELNAGVLFSLLGGTWYGTNSKELIAVAIEHPPTWIAVLYAAFSERSYKNSGITRITERSSFREPGKDFTRAVARLVELS